MILEFFGHNHLDEVSTTTALNVAEISLDAYGDDRIKKELDAFLNRQVKFYQLKEDAYGFARNFGGGTTQDGLYIHNRLFQDFEDPQNHLNLNTLHNTHNTAQEYTKVKLLKRLRLAVGYIDGGRGMQARISCLDKDKVIFYG